MWAIAWGLACARAGDLDSFVALDLLSATAVVPEAVVDDGGPERVAAQDLGITARGEVTELSDRLVVGLDYRGRLPFPGEVSNREQHLVYRADATWRAPQIEATAGRFVAPSAVWLSVDGLQARLHGEPGTLVLFGGRRAISISRRNLPLDTFLPVLGGQLVHTREAVTIDLLANLAGDQLVLGNPGDEVVQDVLGGSAQARVVARPGQRLTVGAAASAANDATFAVGPDAGELVATVQALSLYNARAWGHWRVHPSTRLDATVLHQQATLASDPGLGIEIVDPSFSDLRLRAAIGGGSIGFVRPDVRLRLRSDRTEWRIGAAGELHPDSLGGVYALAQGYLEILTDEQAGIDRSRWKLGGGYERGPALIEAGIGVVERAAGPVSGLSSDLGGLTPTTSEDLSPFVLEAQDVAFARAFLTDRRWFVGADVEANLLDREIRAFVQIGFTGRKTW